MEYLEGGKLEAIGCFFLHYPAVDLSYFPLWMLANGLTIKVALWGEKMVRGYPGCEKDVYEVEVGLHLQPGLF